MAGTGSSGAPEAPAMPRVRVVVNGDVLWQKCLQQADATVRVLEAIDILVGRHPDLSRGRTDRHLLSTLSRMSVQLREEAKRRHYDISEMKLKRSKFALACSTHDNPENVEVSCAAGVDANISRLLMQAAAEKGTEAIVLLGQWQEYKYPLAFLRAYCPMLKVFYVDIGGNETNLLELAAVATHHVLFTIKGVFVKDDVLPKVQPLAEVSAWQTPDSSRIVDVAPYENVAVVVDGSFARSLVSISILKQLKQLIEQAEYEPPEDKSKATQTPQEKSKATQTEEPKHKYKVGRIVVVDSPMGSVSETLTKAKHEVLIKPWHAVKEVEEERWDRRLGMVTVRRQVGVDATVAAVLMQMGADPSVKTIMCFTGDGDFAETVGYIVDKLGKNVRVLTFHSRVADELETRSKNEALDLSALYRESGFAAVQRPTNAGDVLNEVLAWRPTDVVDQRLLVEDPRLRPTVPSVFENEEEYCKSFVGFILEEIREELMQSIRLPDLKGSFKVLKNRPVRKVDGKKMLLLLRENIDFLIGDDTDSDSKVASAKRKAETKDGQANLVQLVDDEEEEEVQFPLLTDSIVLFTSESPLHHSLDQPRGIFALTRYTPNKVEGQKVAMQVLVHADKVDALNNMVERGCYVTLMATVIAHRRALMGLTQSGVRLSDHFRAAILNPAKFYRSLEGQSTVVRQPLQAFCDDLDESQKQACRIIVYSKRPIEVLWGPPGTGKTTTIAKAVLSLLRFGQRVLICAPTNVALLNLLKPVLKAIKDDEALLSRTLLVGDEERLGQKVDLPDDVKPLLIHSRIMAMMGGLDENGEAQSMRRGGGRSRVGYEAAAAHLTTDARLIFSTVASAGRSDMSGTNNPFDVAIIDEASQVLEAHTITILARKPKRLVLAGDPKQLPALTKSQLSRKGLFCRSMMERLYELGPDGPTHKLLRQYRMHPEICHFPREAIYRTKTENVENALPESAHVAPWHSDERYPPYAFIHFGGSENYGGHGMQASVANVSEAMVVVTLLSSFMKHHNRSEGGERVDLASRIGVICPYRAQVATVKQRIAQYPWAPYVTVRTVDDFQGQELDVIIISATRSNDKSGIGFLDDQRRVTVAITRARYSLWILGDAHTLGTKAEGIWQKLITDAQARGTFINAEEVASAPEWLGNMGLQAKADAFKRQGGKIKMADLDRVFKNAVWRLDITEKALQSIEALRTSGRHNNKKGTWSDKGLEQLMHALGRAVRGDAFSSHFSKSPIIRMRLQPGGNDMTVIIIVVIDHHTRRQSLRVWELVTSPADLGKAAASITRFYKSKPAWFAVACTAVTRDGQRRVPSAWASEEALKALAPEDATDVRKLLSDTTSKEEWDWGNWDDEPGVQDAEDTLSLTKVFNANKLNHLYHILVTGTNGADMRLTLTTPQRRVLQDSRSCVVVGRSGTGKTTVAIRRAVYETEKSLEVLKGQATFTQCFLTASPHLSACLQQAHERLIKAEELPSEEDETDKPAEEKKKQGLEELARVGDGSRPTVKGGAPMPEAYHQLEKAHFPIFVTFQQIMELLDASLSQPFLPSNPELRRKQKLRVVTAVVFRDAYWSRFDQNITRVANMGKVWTHLTTHIKGSFAAANHGAPLSELDYIQLVSRELNRKGMSSTAVSEHEAKRIYALYAAYEQLRLSRNEWDMGDFALHLHRELGANKKLGDFLQLDRIYVDEVQDLTESQVSLMRYLSKDGKFAYFFGGDRAQTIAEGVSFHFESLKNYLHGLQPPSEKNPPFVPEIVTLTENKRTHQQVLNVANQVLEMLRGLFPGDLDYLEPERSEATGPKPFFLTETTEKLETSLFANAQDFNFGAKQVILVRNDEAKKRLLDQDANYKGKVLTIRESKGLEFEDVLILSFFKDSALSVNEWRALGTYLQQQGLWADEGVPKEAVRDPPRLLADELKALYVACTRARKRLVVYDVDKDKRRPVFDLLIHLDVVSTHWDDREVFFLASTEDEWLQKGLEWAHNNDLEGALACFQRCNRPDLVEVTRGKIDLRIAERKERDGFGREAAELYEASYRRFKAHLEETKEKAIIAHALKRAIGCWLELSEMARVAPLQEEDGQWKQAAETWVKLKRWHQAAEAYSKANMEKEALEACLTCNDPSKALQLVFSTPVRGDEEHAIRDHYLKRFAHRLRRQQQKQKQQPQRSELNATDQLFMELLGSMSDRSALRDFLTQRHMWAELCDAEEEDGRFEEAAILAERLGDMERAVRCYEHLGLYDEVKRVRMAEALDLLQLLCDQEQVRDTKACVMKDIRAKLVFCTASKHGQWEDAKLCAGYLDAERKPLQVLAAEVEEQWTNTVVPHGGLIRALCLLARVSDEADPRAECSATAIKAYEKVAAQLGTTADAALASLRGKAEGAIEALACSAFGEASNDDNKERVLSGVGKCYALSALVIVTTDCAVHYHRLSEEHRTAAEAAEGLESALRMEQTALMCESLALDGEMQARLLTAITAVIDVKKKLVNKDGQLFKYTSELESKYLAQVQDFQARAYDDILGLCLPLFPFRASPFAIARATHAPDGVLYALGKRAVLDRYWAVLVEEKAANRLTAVPLKTLVSYLLLADSLGLHPPTGWYGSNPPDFWRAFEWASHVQDSTNGDKAQQAFGDCMLAGLRHVVRALFPEGRAVRRVEDLPQPPTNIKSQPNLLIAPHIFLTLAERLVTTICFALGKETAPLLPRSYLSMHMNNREEFLTPLIDRKTPYYQRLYGELLFVLVQVLRAADLLEEWTASAAHFPPHMSSQDKAPLQVLNRLRCYVLINTILCNNNHPQWDFERAAAISRCWEIDGGRRETWAHDYRMWAKLRTWLDDIYHSLGEKLVDTITPAEWKPFITLTATRERGIRFMRELGDPFVLLNVPNATPPKEAEGLATVPVVETRQKDGKSQYVFTLTPFLAAEPEPEPVVAETSIVEQTVDPYSQIDYQAVQSHIDSFDAAAAGQQEIVTLPAWNTIAPPAAPSTETDVSTQAEAAPRVEEELDLRVARRRAAEMFWIGGEGLKAIQDYTQKLRNKANNLPQGQNARPPKVDLGSEWSSPAYQNLFLQTGLALHEEMDALKATLTGYMDHEATLKAALSTGRWTDLDAATFDIYESTGTLEKLAACLDLKTCVCEHPTVAKLTAHLKKVRTDYQQVRDNMGLLLGDQPITPVATNIRSSGTKSKAHKRSAAKN